MWNRGQKGYFIPFLWFIDTRACSNIKYFVKGERANICLGEKREKIVYRRKTSHLFSLLRQTIKGNIANNKFSRNFSYYYIRLEIHFLFKKYYLLLNRVSLLIYIRDLIFATFFMKMFLHPARAACYIIMKMIPLLITRNTSLMGNYKVVRTDSNLLDTNRALIGPRINRNALVYVN